MSLVTKPPVLDETGQRMAAALERLSMIDIGAYQAAQEAVNAAQTAQQQVEQSSLNAEQAALYAQKVEEKMAALLTAMESLADGAAVTAQVAELKVAVEDMTRLSQGMSEEVANLTAMHSTNDNAKLPLLCGQPPILFGNGTPQEAVEPDNWRQFNPETGEGYNWNGEPSAEGQQYINTAAASGGRYIAVRRSYDRQNAQYYNLKWVNS